MTEIIFILITSTDLNKKINAYFLSMSLFIPILILWNSKCYTQFLLTCFYFIKYFVLKISIMIQISDNYLHSNGSYRVRTFYMICHYPFVQMDLFNTYFMQNFLSKISILISNLDIYQPIKEMTMCYVLFVL